MRKLWLILICVILCLGLCAGAALAGVEEPPDGGYGGTGIIDDGGGDEGSDDSGGNDSSGESDSSNGDGGGGSYFTITATAGEGGEISPAGKVRVREGVDKAFTITPDKSRTQRPCDGFIIFDLLVDGKQVSLTDEYTFEDVGKDHAIEVIFAKGDMASFQKTAVYAGYPDVDESQWYGTQKEGVIRDVTLLTIMEGDGVNFHPSDSIRLCEVIKMAAVVYNTYYGGIFIFDQSQSNHWYDTYVDFAIRHGIIQIDDFTDYEAYARRDEMAYIFAHSLPVCEFPPISEKTPPDVLPTDKYGAEIYLLYAAGVLWGNDAVGTFAPSRFISRAEAAAIIARVALPEKRL